MDAIPDAVLEDGLDEIIRRLKDGIYVNPELKAELQAMDKRTQELMKAIRGSVSDEADDEPSDVRDHEDLSGLGKGRLVPVDRAIAAIHLFCAKMSFHILPGAWKLQIMGILGAFAEQQVARIALLQIVGKANFLSILVNMFQGLFSVPETTRILGIIQRGLDQVADKAKAPFIPTSKHDSVAVAAIPQLDKSCVLRHPPSGGAPSLGLDGKLRGRPRKVRDVQTRHKYPVKSKNYKKTHWY